MSAHSGLIEPTKFQLVAAQLPSTDGRDSTAAANALENALPPNEAAPSSGADPNGNLAEAQKLARTDQPTQDSLKSMLDQTPADTASEEGLEEGLVDDRSEIDTRDGADESSGDEASDIPRLLSPPLRLADGDAGQGLPLDRVVASVQSFFPLLQVAFLERDRTAGDQLAAWGAFDTKIKGRTENQPLGFYENYQHSGGVNQPLYSGGEVYGGYRIGRGSFEPWYLERETNRGGEFKTGFAIPLIRDHDIDARRADLWRATYDRQLAEPAIRQEVIMTIRDASAVYWAWVAAGQQFEIGKAALELAERRNQQIQRRVEEGDLDEPSLADNRRAIIQRQGKLIDLERKLVQTAIKLSLFLRDESAQPLIPTEDDLAQFPEIIAYDLVQLQNDITYAVQNRPELASLDTLVRRVRVDFAEACNETLPALDAISNISQDMGEPTSSKRDKSEFELEIGFEFEMPVQRRKGFGKMRSARAKLGQIAAKRQFTVEKISTEVQNAAAALDAAFQRVSAIADAVEISEELAQIERRKFELGESDLLAVFLREQIAIEAASDLMTAKFEYFLARADYTAALAYEFPVLFTAAGTR